MLQAPLPVFVGWILCIAFGCSVILMTPGVLTPLLYRIIPERFLGILPNSVTAADVVFRWAWVATLLQSSNMAFSYGVSGPFWYASAGIFQVLMFLMLSIEIQRKCPEIHTVG